MHGVPTDASNVYAHVSISRYTILAKYRINSEYKNSTIKKIAYIVPLLRSNIPLYTPHVYYGNIFLASYNVEFFFEVSRQIIYKRKYKVLSRL